MTASRAVIPPALRDGDVIGVCAPAGRPTSDRLRRGLDRLAERFTVRLGPVARAALDDAPPYEPRFLAADDRARASELGALLADRDVRAVFCARGGYGAMRILPMLDSAALAADPKPIVGFSDITALLAWAERAGVRGVHGPVITQLGELSADDAAWLHRVLTDRAPLGRLPWSLTPSPGGSGHAVAGGRDGRARVRGPLVAANLMILARLVGTPWQIDARGAVLLIEEVDEAPYAIDRELTQLGLAGALDGVAAGLVGDLVRCAADRSKPDGEPRESLASIVERLGSWRIPALTGAPVGHGTRNAAVPYGAATEVDLASGVVEILDSAVA